MRNLVLLVLCLAVPSLSLAQSCRHSKDYDFSVDATVLEAMSIDVGAGKLAITGAATDEVRVEARACASTSGRLDDLDLTHRVRNNELDVRTEFFENRSFLSWLSFGNNYAYIDIEVTVPDDLPLDVDDGSGEVDISGVASVRLEDGSGSTNIENVAGDVSVDDGSGEIDIRDVQGTVTVSDGSGSISIRNSNEVIIRDDGSGEIRIENIQANVRVDDDGSGGIRIRDVGGNVDIGDDGSGGVDVSGVAGSYHRRED